MARLRKFVSYRNLERPYTRYSKFRKKSFIRISPNIKIVRFDMGNTKKRFEQSLDLITKASLQIRQEAIESARQTAARLLEKELGKLGFYFKIRKYPFHILRENPLASGAGADRMSTGMQKSFGKPIGVALRIKEGEKLMTVSVDKQNIKTARKALERAASKMPCSFAIRMS